MNRRFGVDESEIKRNSEQIQIECTSWNIHHDHSQHASFTLIIHRMYCFGAVGDHGFAYKEFNAVNCMSLFRDVKDSTIVVALFTSSAPIHMQAVCTLNLIAMHASVQTTEIE